MIRLLIRLMVAITALAAAAWLIPGIEAKNSGWIALAVTAVILELINSIMLPWLRKFTFPPVFLILAVIFLVVNTYALWMASSISVHQLDLGFYVQGFWSAFLGALMVSILSSIFSAITAGKKKTA